MYKYLQLNMDSRNKLSFTLYSFAYYL